MVNAVLYLSSSYYLSEGSTTAMVDLSQFSVPMKKNWYEETLFQDAQDPNADLEEYEALIEDQLLE